MNNQHSYLLCEIYGNRHISAITREARCVNRHTILVWKLLRCYPKLKVNIAPRKINRLFLPQVTEIGVIVNPICPFFCKVSHHLPILHEGWSFCRKFRRIYSNKYLESRSPGVNSANVFAFLKWLKTQCSVLWKSNASELRQISWLFLAFQRNFTSNEISSTFPQTFKAPIVLFLPNFRILGGR